MTRGRIAVSAAFAFLIVLYLFSTYRDLGRGPHIDEVEALHTATRMARGDRIYVDFAQHHPPLFYPLLMPLVHDEMSVEAIRGYVMRARVLVALITAVAIAMAALLVWRVAGNPWAVVVFVSLVFAAGGIWRAGLGDVRPDTTAAALWWAGAVLILWTDKRDRLSSVLRGVGVGLIFVAGLVIPRWPLMSLVMGIVALVRIGRDWRALLVASAAAVVTAGAGLGAVALVSDLHATYFFTVDVTRGMFEPYFAGLGTVFSRCPPLVKPLNMLLAGTVIVVAWLRHRDAFGRADLVPVLLAVNLASLIEIRFFYPYPTVDYRYYVGWVLAASALLALLPQAGAALLSVTSESLRKLARPFAVACIVLALAAATDVVGPRRPQPETYWQSTAWILARMGPGDTAWLGDRRPVGVTDASYYALLGDLLETSLRLQTTERGRRFLPAIGDADLPPCRVERGLDRNLRFTCEPGRRFPASQACFDRLRRRGVFVRTPYAGIWRVVR